MGATDSAGRGVPGGGQVCAGAGAGTGSGELRTGSGPPVDAIPPSPAPLHQLARGPAAVPGVPGPRGPSAVREPGDGAGARGRIPRRSPRARAGGGSCPAAASSGLVGIGRETRQGLPLSPRRLPALGFEYWEDGHVK